MSLLGAMATDHAMLVAGLAEEAQFMSLAEAGLACFVSDGLHFYPGILQNLFYSSVGKHIIDSLEAGL